MTTAALIESFCSFDSETFFILTISSYSSPSFFAIKGCKQSNLNNFMALIHPFIMSD